MRGKKVKRKVTALAAATLLLISFSVFSESTASVTLTGSVDSILGLELESEAISQQLPLYSQHGETDLLVGTIIEKSNNAGGYTVAISAENDTYALINQQNSNKTLDYTLSYGNTAVGYTTVSSSPQVVTDSNTTTSGTGESKEVRITYFVENSQFKGDYKHTLTFTITAKE